jgi:subtilisin family serine protease
LLRDGIPHHVEPNVIGITTATNPNDTYYATQQWGLENTGQSSGAVTGYLDADIDASLAWDLTQGSLSNVVGVIDTGVGYAHPDLHQNIWINQKEIPSGVDAEIKNDTGWDVDGDGKITFRDLNDPVNQGPGEISDLNGNGRIDGGDILTSSGSGGWADGAEGSDSNSLVDDFIGWDFADGDKNPDELAIAGFNGHGTHVAGTIAAQSNNSAGVAGVSWNAQVMALKIFTVVIIDGVALMETSAADAASAMNYATAMKDLDGVNVRATNNSYQIDANDLNLSSLSAAVESARLEEIMVVASAGNGGGDSVSDVVGAGAGDIYPASFTHDNVITVAATDRTDALTSWSNYGSSTVDLGAPGEEIYGLTRGTVYFTLSGTSQAAPHVTGAALLLWSAYSGKTVAQVKDALLNSADVNASLYGRTVSGGRLNARRALDYFKGTSLPSFISGSGAETITVQLNGSSVEVVVAGGGTTSYPCPPPASFKSMPAAATTSSRSIPTSRSPSGSSAATATTPSPAAHWTTG